MTMLNLARIAKLVALFGFFFPWVLVSCSGQPIAHLTGIDLAIGGLGSQGSAHALQNGQPNIWVLLTLVAVIGGLLASFLMRGRQALVAVAALAIAALIASAIGIASVTSSAPAEGQSAGNAALIPSDLQYGYFITVAGLLAAIGASGAGLAGRKGGGPGP